MSNQMWGGRFASGPDAIMEEINASIDFDKKVYTESLRRFAQVDTDIMLAGHGLCSGPASYINPPMPTARFNSFWLRTVMNRTISCG